MPKDMIMKSISRVVLGAFLLLALCSCGAGFRKEWKQAQTDGGINGRWSGSWKSEVNGHQGFLRCVVKDGPSEGKKTFVYRAGWMKILATTVITDKTVTKTADGWKFTGSEDLGLYGDFSSAGAIKGNDFSATYSSSLDKGTFTMKRADLSSPQ